MEFSVGEGEPAEHSISARYVIYYTTDGSDPRLEGGALSDAATVYTEPIVIPDDLSVQARARVGSQWSALCEATSTIR